MDGATRKTPPSDPASSPESEHVSTRESNMAGAEDGANPSATHGGVSPLPILERIEAEMAAELLAQLDTQRPGDSQELSCGQIVASPVHLDDAQPLPSQDSLDPPLLERVDIEIDLPGVDNSPVRRSSSEYSASLLQAHAEGASQIRAPKPTKPRKSGGTHTAR